MKIGILKETKSPIDNRVALVPEDIVFLKNKYPEVEFVVQKSPIRAYPDDAYAEKGVDLVDDVSDCDILFGIKEAKIESLIPNKHYFFFGHIAKMQLYNKPLLKKFLEIGITFSDYEYLVDDKNQRVCAFGWWAGVVGVYYTLRAYGLRSKSFDLPKPDLKFTLKQLIDRVNIAKQMPIKILVTGNGRVSHGAQYVLDSIGAVRLTPEEYIKVDNVEKITYTVADVDQLVRCNVEKTTFSFNHFFKAQGEYKSDFDKFARSTDVLISCHFWSPEAPVFLTKEDLENPSCRIRVIGDVTCDIEGSIKSTLRSSTHDDPFYDYNPNTGKEEPAFSSEKNITVMAVDTCPNALAVDTSEYFGKMLIEHVFEPILRGEVDTDKVIARSTIVKNGKITDRFSYLRDYAEND